MMQSGPVSEMKLFNYGDATSSDYVKFIADLHRDLEDTAYADGTWRRVPILRPEVVPRPWFDIEFTNGVQRMIFRFLADNLNLLAYRRWAEDKKTGNWKWEQWIELKLHEAVHSESSLHQPQTLLFDSMLVFGASYKALGGCLENVLVSRKMLDLALGRLYLADPKNSSHHYQMKRDLLVVIFMFVEAARFREMAAHVFDNYDNEIGVTVPDNIISRFSSWSYMSDKDNLRETSPLMGILKKSKD